jgi:electron transfer flavoprotein alpha subunit
MSQTPERILVIAELQGGRLPPLTLELFTLGKRLADEGAGLLCACVAGYGLADGLEEIACYADEVYGLDHPLLAGFQVDLSGAATKALASSLSPGVILMGHTYDGLELAAQLSGAMGSDLVTDSVHVEQDPVTHRFLCTKEVYGGKAVAIFETETTPAVVTVRPKSHEPAKPRGSKGRVIPFDCVLDPSIARTESVGIMPEQTVDLDTAEVVVAGGRGASSQEAIDRLHDLVAAFGNHFMKAELGVSRPLVDAGLFPRSRQIGQTGERVAPQLYVAVAISGATQHVTGILGAGKIVAINRNKDAPIFDVADYGVVGPLEEVIPAIIGKLEETT